MTNATAEPAWQDEVKADYDLLTFDLASSRVAEEIARLQDQLAELRAGISSSSEVSAIENRLHLLIDTARRNSPSNRDEGAFKDLFGYLAPAPE